jgi:ankyrin repeat protein
MNDWFETSDLSQMRVLFASNPSLIHSISHDKETAVMKASESGHLETVLFLLENGANVNDVDGTAVKQSSLILASQQGHLDVVRTLLNAGADIHYRNDFGETALITAAQEGNVHVLELLIQWGGDVKATNHDGINALTLVMTLFREGHLKKELIDLLSLS